MYTPGLLHNDLSDKAVEDMANVSLHVMRFSGLSLVDDVSKHSVFSRFSIHLTAFKAWDSLLEQNQSANTRVSS
ncbi:transposase [Nitrosomonas aestuarii]|uniref:transposase n=1 Tax=Nitrosomonas aestuarii TaxID=52441 RepID=UPI00244E6A0B|nr:transposase [Nitrosomonas aestuarii]